MMTLADENLRTVNSPSVNGTRLLERIEALAQIGALEEGGVSRLAFTEEDLAARSQVRDWMVEAGMTVSIDAAGNLIGRYPGSNPALGSLATGSHIDTVARGGKYDGCLGVLAGIELVQTLHEHGIQLPHPIEVIVFTDEESSVIGSKAMAGQVKLSTPDFRLRNGRYISDCLSSIGGNWDLIQTAARSSQQIAAFVELHVEQGGELERENCAIGIVTGIVGQYRYQVSIQGQANHAGTTPMQYRQDALVAAARIILAVQEIVTRTAPDAVGTVGYLSNAPNVSNTIPGRVDLSLDLRDLNDQVLTQILSQLFAEINTIADQTRTIIHTQQTLQISPTLASPGIMADLEELCDRQGISHLRLPSRAGHDAQEIGRITEMGMIFVPSQGGISHDHTEFTAPDSCIQGTQLLLEMFLKQSAHALG